METKNIGILEASLRYSQEQGKLKEPPSPVFVLTAEGSQDEIETQLIEKIIINTIVVIAFHKYGRDNDKFIDEIVRLRNIHLPNFPLNKCLT